MHPQQHQTRCGITLVEVLIVIAILGLLFQLMFPAIESSREAARRSNCTSNLRQVGLAVGVYESVKQVLPPGFTLKPHTHNWAQSLLPYIECQSVYDLYDFDEDWDSDPNKPATETEIALLKCPSSTRKYHWITDYAIYRFVEKRLYNNLLAENLISKRTSTWGPLRKNEIKMARITDGISKTVFFCEQSGLPDIYLFRDRIRTNVGKGSRWADPESRFDISHRCDGSALGKGTQLINCTNTGEIFSFHPQGANFVFGDASVRFISQDIAPEVLLSLLTATAGD